MYRRLNNFFKFFSIFFLKINSSNQHTAKDLVNFFIFSYRFRLITQTSSASLNKVVRELILFLIIAVQITFQQGCEQLENTHKALRAGYNGNPALH